MGRMHELFITTALGTEALLRSELEELGLGSVRERSAGVSARGDLDAAYAACLWSRVASRVLWPLAEIDASDADSLYRAARELDWTDHLGAEDTFAVEVSAAGAAIAHTGHAGLRLKDAVVDCLRERLGSRPSVDTDSPGFALDLHLRGDRAVVSVDLSGALHRRGYRSSTGPAPLRETLAAALLLRARWPEVAAQGGGLVDPTCGSGTLLVEAAWMVGDVAPGLLRGVTASPAWRGHEPKRWGAQLEEAQRRRSEGAVRIPPIAGYDLDPAAIERARASVEAAEIGEYVKLTEAGMEAARPNAAGGLLIANPPYGARMGDPAELPALYKALGNTMREHFSGWEAALLLGEPGLGQHIGLRAKRRHTFFNGPIECRLLRFEISERYEQGERKPAEASEESEAFANRLRKNQKKLRPWIDRESIEAYRLYDADLPEYAVAVDVYGDSLHVQEYAPPKSIDPDKAKRRLRDVRLRLSEVLEIPRERIFLKTRRKQKGKDQYEKMSEESVELVVREGRARLIVNLSDYLDTGLFLDHRPTRELIAMLANGKRLLNLFCYTATVTVHAALGGARSSTSVDLSRTYLDWGRRNFELNGIDEKVHELVRADCFKWVREHKDRRYDLIFLDPPTFSTSKAMTGTLDVQRDHAGLIAACMELLAAGGTLLFSTNRKKFRLDATVSERWSVEELTAKTIPKDYERSPKVHQCWAIRPPAR
jgi:23S rRNA (guanine2445-N2)-methyltransferase / 23S rRNA (guanine2069-N7)-methyltransferase